MARPAAVVVSAVQMPPASIAGSTREPACSKTEKALTIPMTVPNLAVPVGATLMFVKVLCLVLTDGRSPREAVKP